MPWYLWKRGKYIPDYSVGENEAFVKLCAKTLDEAKEEVGLLVTEKSINDDRYNDIDLPSCFKNRRDEYSIDQAKLFFVEQEIDLESDILKVQKEIELFRKQTQAKQEKETRYQEYLKLQAEFNK